MKIGRKMFTLAAIAIASLAIGAGARAQSTEATVPPLPPDQNVFYQRTGPGPIMVFDSIGLDGFEGEMGGKTVTGAPFTATYSTQMTQTLADENHIVRNSTGAIARDSEGRTRRDITLPAIGPWAASGSAAPHVIAIEDPVAGVHYILEPEKKIARKMPAPIRVNATGKSGPWAKFAANESKETTTESLGTQTIDGVSAEGTRDTRTIPAGAIGNEKPIEVVTERWYSPDLQTVVMTKRSDPRTGERIFQLTNIERQEPEASLFQVPPDYTVKAGLMFVRHHGIATQSLGTAPAPEPPPPPPPQR
ncbi:MAG: hypothetical protein ACRD4S_07965 [Candidatus Acidiferrales bacterium]